MMKDRYGNKNTDWILFQLEPVTHKIIKKIARKYDVTTHDFIRDIMTETAKAYIKNGITNS